MGEVCDILFCCAEMADADGNTCTCFDPCERFMEKRKMCCRNEKMYPLMKENHADIVHCLNCCPITSGWGCILATCLAFKMTVCDKLKLIGLGLLYFLMVPLCCIGWCCSTNHGSRIRRKSTEYNAVVMKLAQKAHNLRTERTNRKMYELKGPVNETLPLPDDEVLDIELERLQAEEAKPVGRRRTTTISTMFEDRELYKK